MPKLIKKIIFSRSSADATAEQVRNGGGAARESIQINKNEPNTLAVHGNCVISPNREKNEDEKKNGQTSDGLRK